MTTSHLSLHESRNRHRTSIAFDGNPSEARNKTLRERATLADSVANVEIGLALLWRELVLGLCRVVDGFFTEDRCYLITEAVNGLPSVELVGRRLEILQSILCGCGQKSVAIDLALAPSTIALNARLALESLGISSRPSRVHPLLMRAAKAAREQDSAAKGSLSFVVEDDVSLRVIGMLRPDARLAHVLPPAELAVARILIEGRCYAEIARHRGTSQRTIANQITAVFRRLDVSGRSELLHRLFAADALVDVTPLRNDSCHHLENRSSPSQELHIA